MRSYAIDTLFDSEYYTGDTEEIETADALRAPDREQFIAANRKEVHSLISETHTLHPLSRTASGGYSENTENKRVWKIRTTLKCKRKKKPNGEPDKHKARAAASGDTLRRAMIKANVTLPVSYSPTIMPLTFSLFPQLATSNNFTRPLWTSNLPISMQSYHRMLTGSSPPWNLTSQLPAASTLHRNIASRAPYMVFLTPAGSCTSTTKGHSSPRVISCLPSTTAYFIESPPLRQRTSLFTSTTPLFSVTLKPISTTSSPTSASTMK